MIILFWFLGFRDQTIGKDYFGVVYVPADSNSNIGLIKAIVKHTEIDSKIPLVFYQGKVREYSRGDTVLLDLCKQSGSGFMEAVNIRKTSSPVSLDSIRVSKINLGNKFGNNSGHNNYINLHLRDDYLSSEGAHTIKHVIITNFTPDAKGRYEGEYYTTEEPNKRTRFKISKLPIGFSEASNTQDLFVYPYRKEIINGVTFEIIELHEEHIH